MKYTKLHQWQLSPADAIRLQSRLCAKVIIRRPRIRDIRFIAGVDVSVKNNQSKAAIVVFTYPALQKIETVISTEKVQFPYVPGLLSFREGPVILKCVKKIKTEPDLFIFDGQGLAHPRRIGLASHMGLILNKPTIGSAKSHLYGSYATPGQKKGSFSFITDANNAVIGTVVRTRDNTHPVFVSPGHLMDIRTATKIILTCCPRYKIPEPIRAAHHAASASP